MAGEARPPKFCPDCGAGLTGETAAVAIEEDRTGDGGYDVYCEACGWSGDVWPDDEHGLRAGEESTKSPVDHDPPPDRIRRR